MNKVTENKRAEPQGKPAAQFPVGTLLKSVYNLRTQYDILPYRIITDGGIVNLHTGVFTPLAELKSSLYIKVDFLTLEGK